MCKAIQDLIAEGINQGLSQGLNQDLERGEENGIALAKKVFRLQARGLSAKEIARECNIPVDKVKWILEDPAA